MDGRADKFTLEGHTPVPCEDLLAWARWFETADRRVALTVRDSGARVSTVFLGLDHAFGHGPPLLFETMIFDGRHHIEWARYSTWEEAEAGHRRLCEEWFGAEGGDS